VALAGALEHADRITAPTASLPPASSTTSPATSVIRCRRDGTFDKQGALRHRGGQHLYVTCEGEGSPASSSNRRRIRFRLGSLNDGLARTPVPAPTYLLVGGSGGSYIAVGFAVPHKPDIAGMVIIDTFEPYSDPPPDLVEETSCARPGNVKHRDFPQGGEGGLGNARGDRGHPGTIMPSNTPGVARSSRNRT
jgi:hypothetical protein